MTNAGITFPKTWNLIPGVALSAEQMALLTSDLFWLVEQAMTLADGSTQKVLALQLYARLQAGDLTNMGTLAGRQRVSVSISLARRTGFPFRPASRAASARPTAMT